MALKEVGIRSDGEIRVGYDAELFKVTKQERLRDKLDSTMKIRGRLNRNKKKPLPINIHLHVDSAGSVYVIAGELPDKLPQPEGS